MLKLLIFLALLASPVVGTSCYTGTFTNAPLIDPSQLNKNTNCNSDYCTIETLSTGQAVKTVYNCGNFPGNGNYVCDGTYSDRQFSVAAGQVTKTCCKGNYCNSSSLSGSFMTVIFSILAIFLTKFC